MNVPKNYPLILIFVALALSGSVGLFNYVVDPYVLFDYENSDADRLSRIDQFNYLRITKPWYIRTLKPTAVVVGSSRSARVHPQHPSWDSLRGYNLAVPGMTIHEIDRFIRHAQAIQPLSKLMIGLDYEAFIRPVPATRPGFEVKRMASDTHDLHSLASTAQYVRDVFDSLFSSAALSRSIAAATGIAPPGRRYFKNGSWETTTDVLTGRGGYIYIGNNAIRADRVNTLDIQDNLERFSDILRFCYRNRIETRLFFTPTHVFFVDLWYQLGYRDMWHDFHRKILALNNSIAKETGNKPFPLWGFSHADGIVNEPIYRKKNAGKAWYDDGVHTRVRLGNKMMNDVWGENAEIGQQLNPENIDAYLKDVVRLMDDFKSKNPKLIKQLHLEMQFTKTPE